MYADVYKPTHTRLALAIHMQINALNVQCRTPRGVGVT
eukprot:COSAG01_NODE_56216_length_319_cov_102.095455_1_plen_37_part_01